MGNNLPITNKGVITTTIWLWRELVIFFLKLHWLHLDSRQELGGEFANFCDSLGIVIQTTLASYVCSNRQERNNKEV